MPPRAKKAARLPKFHRRLPPEWQVGQDRFTGAKVTTLTGCFAHSYHAYFTHPLLYDGGRRMIFSSDRDNQAQIYSLDLDSGEIGQLTDLPREVSRRQDCLRAALNVPRDEIHFRADDRIFSANLRTLARRELYRVPGNFTCSDLVSVTADGQAIVFSIVEDVSDRIYTDLSHGYVGMGDKFAMRPLSRMVKLDLDSGHAEVVHEEKNWITHVNTSPTQPNLVSFCHEGPWAEVDQRIWGLDLETGRTWPIRPRRQEGERIGHEYWLADGLRLGYHGSTATGQPIIGHIGHDNRDGYEQVVTFGDGHIHSLAPDLVAGDDDRFIQLYRWNGSAYDEARALCEHRTSWHFQKCHAHPMFLPDGGRVLFVSNRTGYCQIHLAELPADVTALPNVHDLGIRRK